MNEWKVVIKDHIHDLQVDLIVYRMIDNDHIEYLHLGNSGEFLCTKGKAFKPVKPFLTLSHLLAKELFKGLAEALDNSGIKTDSTHKLEGTLNATKYHLEDLRQMLKLRGV